MPTLFSKVATSTSDIFRKFTIPNTYALAGRSDQIRGPAMKHKDYPSYVTEVCQSDISQSPRALTICSPVISVRVDTCGVKHLLFLVHR